MQFLYNYQNGKEEIICHTCMDEFDGISYGIIQKEYQLFLPTEVREESGSYIFSYNMKGMVNLRAWMNEVSRIKQRRMQKEIEKKQRKILQMGIPQNQLLTEEKYMYIEECTQHIKFICVPATDGKRTKSSYDSSLPSVPPVPKEDVSYKEDKISVGKLEYPGFLWNSEKNSKKESHKNEQGEDSGTIIDREFLEKFHNNIENQLNQETEQKDRSQKSDVTERCRNSDTAESVTVCLNNESEEGEEETVLLTPEFRIDASLKRISTGEILTLDRKVTVVGKSRKNADIVIDGNKTVSRKHCIISVEDGNYYLEDNSSMNGTYLEDVKIRPDEKVILQNGNRVRLSDEEFVFHINEK